MVIGQRIPSNVGFSDNIRIWEGSIVYEVLYLMFEPEAIIGLWPDFWW